MIKQDEVFFQVIEAQPQQQIQPQSQPQQQTRP
jgi:hypothetical protein